MKGFPDGTQASEKASVKTIRLFGTTPVRRGESDREAPMRLGVLVGSALSALVGAGVLWFGWKGR